MSGKQEQVHGAQGDQVRVWGAFTLLNPSMPPPSPAASTCCLTSRQALHEHSPAVPAVAAQHGSDKVPQQGAAHPKLRPSGAEVDPESPMRHWVSSACAASCDFSLS